MLFRSAATNDTRDVRSVAPDDSLTELLTRGVSLRAIVRGLPVFARMFLAIIRLRRRFIVDRPTQPTVMLKEAIFFAFYSSCIDFLLLIPLMMAFHSTVSKWAWFAKSVVGGTAGGVISHLLCKLGRGSATLRQTLACNFYVIGLGPLLMACLLPMLFLLNIGPAVAFDNDPAQIQARFDAWATNASDGQAFLMLALVGAECLALAFALYLWLGWLSYVHRVSAKRLCLIFGVAYVVGSVGFIFVGPNLSSVFDNVVRAVGEGLGHL